MTDEQFKALRTLILEQGVKIEALALAVRSLQRSVETTEVIALTPEDFAEAIDLPDDLKKFFPD
ncbi:MAG: hypothetical protein ACK4SQ_14335 [Allorhizobium sp.]